MRPHRSTRPALPARKLWQEIAAASGGRVWSFLGTLAIVALTARWLGPHGRGTLAAASAWVLLFATLGHLSLGEVAASHATDRPSLTWLAPVLATLLCLVAVITAACWLAAAVLYGASDGDIFHGLSPAVLVVAFLVLPFLLWEEYGSHLLAIIGRIDIYNRAQFVGRLAGFGLVLGALALGWGVVGVLAATAVAQGIVAAGGIRHLAHRAGGAMKPSTDVMKRLLRGGLALHPSAIGAALIFYSGVLMVNYYHGQSETAYYQLAVQLLLAILLIPQAASLVMYRYTTELGAARAWVVQRRALVGVMAAVAGTGLLAVALAPWVIPGIAGERFSPAVGVFQVLLLALVPVAFSILMTPQWITHGRFWQISVIVMSAAVLNIAVNLALTPRYGMYGAAWATTAAFVFVGAADAWLAVRCERSLRSIRRQPVQDEI